MYPSSLITYHFSLHSSLLNHPQLLTISLQSSLYSYTLDHSIPKSLYSPYLFYPSTLPFSLLLFYSSTLLLFYSSTLLLFYSSIYSFNTTLLLISPNPLYSSFILSQPIPTPLICFTFSICFISLIYYPFLIYFIFYLIITISPFIPYPHPLLTLTLNIFYSPSPSPSPTNTHPYPLLSPYICYSLLHLLYRLLLCFLSYTLFYFILYPSFYLLFQLLSHPLLNLLSLLISLLPS
jgi:hypothetical protein